MDFRSFKYAVLAAPLFLAACGDGYEMIRTDTMFPYGNQRTAGSGVAYVLAKMMPEKELNLVPAEQPAPPPAPMVEETKETAGPAPQPEVQPMDKVFNDAVEK